MQLRTKSTQTSSSFSFYGIKMETAQRFGVLSDLFDRLFYFRDDVFRQWRVGQSRGHRLPFGEHPTQEIGENLAVRRILRLLRNQQPSEARDWIGVLSR